MLRLSKVIVTQFKNYSFSTFNFTERVIGICGLNGKGKTNLLDAIYYLCFTKSYFTKTDGMNTRFNADGFRLEGLSSANNDNVVCIFRGNGKKEVFLNGAPYTRFSAHIGKFPCVMVAPDDIELITGGSEERRRFMDTLISQVDQDYLQHLIVYNKVLLQRNSVLKRFAEEGKTDWTLLEVLDDQLVQPGNYIFTKRKEYSSKLIPIVQQFYALIAGRQEAITLQYESQLLNHDFFSLLNQFRQKDFILQRSNGGIHKDDILINLDGQVFKNTASQGQRKSLLFALKLAEFEMLKTDKGFPPLLLLDDVFEKLDDNRIGHLLQWVCKENDGQVFITDTQRDRLEKAFQHLETDYQIIELE